MSEETQFEFITGLGTDILNDPSEIEGIEKPTHIVLAINGRKTYVLTPASARLLAKVLLEKVAEVNNPGIQIVKGGIS